MSVVKLRIEIERTLRAFLAARGEPSNASMSIGPILQDLKRRGLAPPSTDKFLKTLRLMNEAAHGLDIDPEATEQAITVGTEFLAELSAIDPNS
jgi:hypothetical protein